MLIDKINLFYKSSKKIDPFIFSLIINKDYKIDKLKTF